MGVDTRSRAIVTHVIQRPRILNHYHGNPLCLVMEPEQPRPDGQGDGVDDEENGVEDLLVTTDLLVVRDVQEPFAETVHGG